MTPVPRKAIAPQARKHRLRIRLVLWGFIAGFGLVAQHLVQVQLHPDEEFKTLENSRIGSARITGPRGNIVDRNGALLATDRRVPSLWANPRAIKDPYLAAQRLSAAVGISENTAFTRLTRRTAGGDVYEDVPVKRWLSDEEFERVPQLRQSIPGLTVKMEDLRFYPEGELAAHVLGFANREGRGGEGVELAFDKHLHTTPGRRTGQVDIQRKILSSLTLEYQSPEGGDTLVLTIDAAIQHTLEQEIDAALTRCNATNGTGIVMDPRTGAILALACRPAFDPNFYNEYPAELMKNRATIDFFEPGSSFKIVSAAGAIEEGLITPDTLVDCKGGLFRFYNRRTIRDVHKMGVVPFRDAFAESSNIGIIQVAEKLGPARLEKWMRRFGFGERTSRHFRNESAGVLRPGSQWSGLSMISIPMGQEIATTSLQLAKAFSTIANDGYPVEPHLVERAISKNGVTTYAFDPPAFDRVLSQRTADLMKELLHGVVTHGTGEYANIPEFRVGGKTGTAQIARTDGPGYYPDRYTTVFAGFAPIADPRLTCVIVIHDPQIDLHYGGYVCGPVFQKVMRDALIHLDCPEDPVAGPTKPQQVPPMLDPDSLVAQTAPDPPSSGDPPIDPEVLLELTMLRVDDIFDGPRLPNFTGLTRRQAREEAQRWGLDWTTEGSGWVVSQYPPADTPLVQVAQLSLVLSNQRNAFIDEAQSNMVAAGDRLAPLR